MRPSFFDITPDTYCTLPDDELPQGPAPPTAPLSPYAPLNQSVKVAIPDAPAGTLHTHVRYYWHTIDADQVYFRMTAESEHSVVEGGEDQRGTWYTTTNPAAPTFHNSEPARDLPCAARAVAGPGAGTAESTVARVAGQDGRFLDDNGEVRFSKYDVIQVHCANVVISYPPGQSGESDVLVGPITFDRTVPARMPYFQALTMDLESDVWGWGTGVDDDGFDDSFMGIGFLMTMVVLSATAGFRKAHIPASLIVFYSIIAAATYFQVIDVPTGILSGVLVLVIVGIFAVGLKR